MLDRVYHSMKNMHSFLYCLIYFIFIHFSSLSTNKYSFNIIRLISSPKKISRPTLSIFMLISSKILNLVQYEAQKLFWMLDFWYKWIRFEQCVFIVTIQPWLWSSWLARSTHKNQPGKQLTSVPFKMKATKNYSGPILWPIGYGSKRSKWKLCFTKLIRNSTNRPSLLQFIIIKVDNHAIAFQSFRISNGLRTRHQTQ